MTLRGNEAGGAEAGGAEADFALDYCPEHPLDLARTLSPLQRGRGDPTSQWMPDGSVWRTQRTPLGPASLHLEPWRSGAKETVVRARAWGPGAEWSLARVPALLGEGDDPETLDLAAAAARPVPGWPASAVAALPSVQRRRPGVRLTRTELVLEAAVPAVLEQKVTGVEARRAWRRLLLQHGEVPPGEKPWYPLAVFNYHEGCLTVAGGYTARESARSACAPFAASRLSPRPSSARSSSAGEAPRSSPRSPRYRGWASGRRPRSRSARMATPMR